MSKDLIVAILVPVIDATGRTRYCVGTGCAVGDGQILTARHVVCPKLPRDMKRKVRVCWYDRDRRCWPDDTGTEVDDSDIWWCGMGNDEVGDCNSPDVALIDCPRHRDFSHIPSPRLAPDWPKEGTWSSRGFPMIADSATRKHFDFDGTIKSHASKDAEMVLAGREGSLARDAERAACDWSGASGMPVLAGNQIIGVVTQVLPDITPPQYIAVPTEILLARADFRARYRRAGEDDLIQIGRKLLIQLLEQNKDVLPALRKRLTAIGGGGNPGLEDIAEQILKIPVETLIESAVDVQHELRRSKGYPAADIIARLVQIVLPLSCDPSDIRDAHEVAATGACCLVPIRASSVTLAELVIAGAERRSASFRPQRNLDDWPRGIGCIAHLPEGGRDPSAAQAIRDFTTDLAEVFETHFDDDLETDFRNYLKRTFAARWIRPQAGLLPGQVEQYEQGLVRIIRKEIARHAEHVARHYVPGNKGFAYYFVAETPRGMDAEARATRDGVLLRLKQTFPEITFLSLAPESLCPWEELEPYLKLRDLLYAGSVSADQEHR